MHWRLFLGHTVTVPTTTMLPLHTSLLQGCMAAAGGPWPRLAAPGCGGRPLAAARCGTRDPRLQPHTHPCEVDPSHHSHRLHTTPPTPFHTTRYHTPNPRIGTPLGARREVLHLSCMIATLITCHAIVLASSPAFAMSFSGVGTRGVLLLFVNSETIF